MFQRLLFLLLFQVCLRITIYRVFDISWNTKIINKVTPCAFCESEAMCFSLRFTRCNCQKQTILFGLCLHSCETIYKYFKVGFVYNLQFYRKEKNGGNIIFSNLWLYYLFQNIFTFYLIICLFKIFQMFWRISFFLSQTNQCLINIFLPSVSSVRLFYITIYPQ